MKIQSKALGLSAGLVVVSGFALCAIAVAIAPAGTMAFLGWVLHMDFTAVTGHVSPGNFVGGVLLFGAYIGLLVGLTAALYNRLSTPRV